jgi:hypothetical protein
MLTKVTGRGRPISRVELNVYHCGHCLSLPLHVSHSVVVYVAAAVVVICVVVVVVNAVDDDDDDNEEENNYDVAVVASLIRSTQIK